MVCACTDSNGSLELIHGEHDRRPDIRQGGPRNGNETQVSRRERKRDAHQRRMEGWLGAEMHGEGQELAEFVGVGVEEEVAVKILGSPELRCGS